MLNSIIALSLRNKIVILLSVVCLIGYGVFAATQIPIGAVPDITNNQVQVITTTRDMSTADVERLLTYPVELEMSNLPGVKDIRSVSKFGLSVVTVVFEDEMGTYLPRQLIAEKLVQIADKMPPGQPLPFMGPISTGLGEIYQYILDVKPAYKGNYTVQELRSIQDWIVKRQLSGIPGVVEVNTWGGFLKTYEVAIDPHKLNAANIGIEELCTAIETNNSVVGGGYIEKSQEAYFIRANAAVKSIADIENIVVKSVNSHPIFVKDIAKVQFGSATRFGAITGNGEGEKVMGQVMMLKGSNSKSVIDAVESRVAEIQKSLPEGTWINPVLSRTELIDKTTFTISENLILGFLIVLFVVVLLLGNWRSGLIVASVIPLTLLFALSMMYVFGVDANLMSLGAIDFGIIIDGAVIIVEYITYLFSKNSGLKDGHNFTSEDRDKLAQQGASKMMHSAVFGQLIIIIVFIPILTLDGVEGKMFKPMGITFCFALIGAMILCFTYVPVMASLFINGNNNPKNIGSKMIDLIKKGYEPLLLKMIQYRQWVLTIVGVIFLLSVLLFTKMGGEFVPTLDEGDFVIQPVLKTGMSLAATVEMTTRIEKIIKTFPEVKQVVSRIGAAEVPTDPMSMEESDVIITLHNKNKWTTAKTKDGLADTIKAAILAQIPNIEVEFTQPIEMRFNELISGARSDLAIKLFGEDLDVLYEKAGQIEKLISGVNGIADLSVEKIDGLPQISVDYDREKIARYGISIQQLNDVVQAGFAGKSIGTFHEGEKQYDIVIKYAVESRSDIDQVKAALVQLPNGEQMPLSNFATITYDTGPARISRDFTKRRAIIGANIRGRDIQSVVKEVKLKIDKSIQLPVGYQVEYDGQFKNLENATNRLLIAVPIALVLIFIMLFFAFDSLRETLLIYTAIPLSAIGGILALYIRDMPFSISAGVGFIALFGIAVLNGIVMIEHFNELKKDRTNDADDYIIAAAVDRIRPVLLTAIAAALGFLPMAISQSAGAEVQKPLATVVIGGLVSATLLTLIILPILYIMFAKKNKTIGPKIKSSLIIFFIISGSGATVKAQSITLQQLISEAQSQSFATQLNDLSLLREKNRVDAVLNYNNYDFFYGYDRNNLTNENRALHVFGIAHVFQLPAVNHSKRELQKAKVHAFEKQSLLSKFEIAKLVSQLFESIQFNHAKLNAINQADSIYTQYYKASLRKNELGASDKLEVYLSQQKQQEFAIQKLQLIQKIEEDNYGLQLLTQNSNAVTAAEPYIKWTPPIQEEIPHPLITMQESMIAESRLESDHIKKEALPDLQFRIFNGFGSFNSPSFYPGVEMGLSVPLHRRLNEAKIKTQNIETEVLKLKKEAQINILNNEKNKILNNLKQIENILQLHQQKIQVSENLKSAAATSLALGKIDYLQYHLIIAEAINTQFSHLEILHEYNQNIISLQYLNY